MISEEVKKGIRGGVVGGVVVKLSVVRQGLSCRTGSLRAGRSHRDMYTASRGAPDGRN